MKSFPEHLHSDRSRGGVIRRHDPPRAASQLRVGRGRPRIRQVHRRPDRPQGATMTSRYIHTADPVLLAAADAVAGRIVELMER